MTRPLRPTRPNQRDRRWTQRVQSRTLDSSLAVSVCAFLRRHPSYANPWALSKWLWLAGFILVRCAIALYDHLVVAALRCVGAELLPTRRPSVAADASAVGPVRYVRLDAVSVLYLSINALHEYVFVQRLCHYLYLHPSVPKAACALSLLNTAVALALMFVVLDASYAPCHHLLHTPSLYPLVHKHHHRQHYPTRGYLDAGNEHPLEHWIGVMCTWVAVLAAANTVGAHAFTIFVFFNLHAALAMLNHSPYDVRWDALSVLGAGTRKKTLEESDCSNRDRVRSRGRNKTWTTVVAPILDVVARMTAYSVANHEMHHRKFTVNYAQYCMWYDHLVGTYASYEGPKMFVGQKKTTKKENGSGICREGHGDNDDAMVHTTTMTKPATIATLDAQVENTTTRHVMTTMTPTITTTTAMVPPLTMEMNHACGNKGKHTALKEEEKKLD